MADRLRIGTFSSGGRFTTALDLNDGTKFALLRDTLKITPAEESAIYSKSARRYGGAKQVAEFHGNGTIEADWYIRGATATADLALAQFDLLADQAESTTPGRFIEWRPDGATRSTYFEIMGTAPWEPVYRWIEFQATKTLHVKAAFPVAPLAQGDPLDITDPFDVDSIADYTFDAGAGSLSVSGGQLVPSSTGVKRIIHTARGYSLQDAEATLKYTTGATVAGQATGLELKRLDGSNFLEAYVFGPSTIDIAKTDAGVGVTLSPAITGSVAIAANTTYWFRFRIEGNLLTAEHWTSEPTPTGTPTATATVVLSGANATKFGTGVGGQAGVVLTVVGTDYRYDDFTVKPYSYRDTSTTSADRRRLLRSIPGTAPAKVDVDLTLAAHATPPAFGLIGWAKRQAVENLITSGDFEDSTRGTSGWTGTSAANLIANVSTLSRVTTAAKFGIASMQIVTPAAVNAGAAYRVYGRFRKGVTYTFKGWIRAASGTTQIQLIAGQEPASDFTSGTAAALSTSQQEITVAWTPTADRDYADFAVRQTTATATTFTVDGVRVYEGTTEPSTTKQAEGAGGLLPLGIIEAEAALPVDTTNWIITASALGSAGYFLQEVAVSGAETFTAAWLLDPNLLPADEFGDEVAIEIFSKIKVESTLVSPKVVLSATPEDTALGVTRYTEHGSAGKLLVKSASATARRVQRLGTITLPRDGQRWKLTLTLTTQAGSTGTLNFDHLNLVPAKQRALSPTGKPNDTTYPKFVNTAAANLIITRTIKSDLSGLITRPPARPTAGPSLGGQRIEPPPGDVNVTTWTRQLVPDDPTLDSATDDVVAYSDHTHYAIIPRYFLTRSS